METNKILIGHALDLARQLPDNSIHCVITSPPYWGLRSYGTNDVYWPAISYSPMPGLPEITIPEQEASLGLEPDPWAFIGHLVLIFREVKRALHPMGTAWVNMGDSYAGGKNGRSAADTKLIGKDDRTFRDKPFSTAGNGLKAKNLVGQPWRLAFALQADGWILRMDNIWHKPNPMPASVQDRPTTAHEYFFLLSKSERYFYDIEATKEPATEANKVIKLGQKSFSKGQANGAGIKPSGNGTKDTYEVPSSRNRRSVWSIPTESYQGSHFATFPRKLVTPALLAGCPEQVCPECGNPHQRVIERKVTLEAGRNQIGLGPKTLDNPMMQNGHQGSTLHHTVDRQTIGFEPTCQHNLAPIPGIVLDPFMGSGTTARVAIAHRRHYLGFELNERYVQELVPDRLNGVQIRF